MVLSVQFFRYHLWTVKAIPTAGLAVLCWHHLKSCFCLNFFFFKFVDGQLTSCNIKNTCKKRNNNKKRNKRTTQFEWFFLHQLLAPWEHLLLCCIEFLVHVILHVCAEMHCVNESRLASEWLRNLSAVTFSAISNHTLVGDVCTTGHYTVIAFWSQNVVFDQMLEKSIVQKQLHWSCHLYKEFMYFIVAIHVFLKSYWIALIQIQTWFLLDVLRFTGLLITFWPSNS